jgi:hypothetical protein
LRFDGRESKYECYVLTANAPVTWEDVPTTYIAQL